MQYWLVKTEPETYSWDTLVKEKKGVWDGVRNFQARGNMKTMKKGDLVFVYHTGEEKSIVGLAKVASEPYPEPKDKDWVAVDLTPDKKLKKAISLAQVKADKKLANMVLVRASRLSVQPVKQEEFDYIVELSQQ
jgi:predicted RNA-binding protein with PUA-like domain